MEAGGLQRLEVGCPVHCSDGPFGELADLVVDPATRRITHLVVEPHHRHDLARLVPVELAVAEKRSVALRCTTEDAWGLTKVEGFAYLQYGELPVDDPDWEVGIQTVYAQPYQDDYRGLGGRRLDPDPPVAFAYDRVPEGEVELGRATVVLSADDHVLGHVEGFLIDGGEQITHLVLARGHVCGRREATVPVGAVARVATDSVTLTLTKDEVRSLPAVPVRREPHS